MSEEERHAKLKPVDSLLPDHTPVTLDADNAGRFLSGLRRRGSWQDNEHVAVYGPPAVEGLKRASTGPAPTVLLGTAHVTGGELIPSRLLSPPEVAQILESNL